MVALTPCICVLWSIILMPIIILFIYRHNTSGKYVDAGNELLIPWEILHVLLLVTINVCFILESSGPHPHTGDCKNRTALASRKGTLHLKPVRFIIKVGKPQRTSVIRGSCEPKGEIDVGTHFIVCNATDPDTQATGTCSYWLSVRGMCFNTAMMLTW